MKKFIALVLILLMISNISYALNIDDITNKIIDLTQNNELDMSIQCHLNSLYPYDDSQTAIYSKALSKFKYSFSQRTNKNNKPYYLSSLDFADKNIFTNVEFDHDNNHYIVNSLLKPNIMTSASNVPVFKLLDFNNIFDKNDYFDAEKAENDLFSIISNIDNGEKKKRVNFNVKGFQNPYKQANIDITSNNISQYTQTIFNILKIGLADSFTDTLSIKLSNRYTLRVLYDKNNSVTGIRLNGDIYINGTKQNINSTLNFTDDLSKIEIDSKIKANNKQYIYCAVTKDSNTVNVKFESLQNNIKTIQEKLYTLSSTEYANTNSLNGTYMVSNIVESNDGTSSQKLELIPNISIDKANKKHYMRGSIAIKYTANNILMLDMLATLGSAGNIQVAHDISKTIDVAISNGGINKNLSYFDTKNTSAMILDVDNIDDNVKSKLIDEMKKQFSARVLRAMLAQEDNSAYILSYGMQEEDWNEFLKYYHSLEE